MMLLIMRDLSPMSKIENTSNRLVVKLPVVTPFSESSRWTLRCHLAHVDLVESYLHAILGAFLAASRQLYRGIDALCRELETHLRPVPFDECPLNSVLPGVLADLNFEFALIAWLRCAVNDFVGVLDVVVLVWENANDGLVSLRALAGSGDVKDARAPH